MENINKNIYSTGEIASFCGVSNKTVLKWIKNERILAFKLPGEHFRIKKIDFLDFLSKNNMPVPNELIEKNGKKKILIIDDEKSLVSALCRFLELDGRFEYETAYNGIEAGIRLGKYEPDLILLDVVMPKADGFTTLSYIKSIKEFKNIKIIVISGNTEQKKIKQLLDMGADIFLSKPFTNKELISGIEKLLCLTQK